MPGYVIHIAIAKQYMKNFKVNNEKAFINGVIAPDLLAKKSKDETHYGIGGSSKTNLKKFLDKNKIETDYMQGYFLHLISDYLFYNKYFTKYNVKLYNDYDILNKELIEKYNIVVPSQIKSEISTKTGNLQILDRKKLNRMIEEISKKNLKDYQREIIMEENKWSIN